MPSIFNLKCGCSLIALCWLSSCGPKTSEREEGNIATGTPLATPESVVPVPLVTTTPVPVATPPPMLAPERAPASALDLERRYYASGTTPDERLEIIADLGALEAGEALGRVYQKEKRWETRMKVLEVAGDLDSDRQHEPKLALLQTAVAPAQNRLLRLVALDLLGGFEDPRAVKLVESIARSDADREVRAAAQAFVDAWKATPPVFR